MAGNAPQVQYRDEMVLAFGQRQSLLRETTTPEMVVKGNQATFLVADSSGVAVTRGLNGLIPAGDNSNSQLTATLVEYHDLIKMTGFNIFASQSNQRAIMQINTMAKINRNIDSVLLTELANTSLDTGAAATATMTMVSKALATLGNNGVPMDGNIFGVISPAFQEYLSVIPSWASADFVNVKPLSNYPGWNHADPKKGAGTGWWEWKGVKWIVSNQLSGVGTSSCTCFMYHRAAIGHAVDTSGIDSQIGVNDEQQYSWARCSLFHGAKMLQNAGIIRMIHDDSAFVAS